MVGEFSKEAGKGAGQAIINTAQDACDGLGHILGPAANNLRAILDDTTRYWQIKNAVKIQDKVQRICQERGLTPEQLGSLSVGDSIRTIDAASYEEEDDVQELWARLIANAISPGGKETVKKVYVDILRSVSSPEAALLELLWTCETKASFRNAQEISAFNKGMNALAETKWRKFPADVQAVAIQNLTRIRCITFRPRQIKADGMFALIPDSNDRFRQWSAIDPKKFQEVMEKIADLIFAAAAVKEYESVGSTPFATSMLGPHEQITVREMNYMLTALGKDLMNACNANPAEGAMPTPKAMGA